MKKEIYVVGFYDYFDRSYCIDGYFSDREEADKYRAKHSKERYFIKTIYCIDNLEDLSYVFPNYEHTFKFRNRDNSWEIYEEEFTDKYSAYCDKYFRSNYITGNTAYINVTINTSTSDRITSQIIAKKLLNQFLEFCNYEPNKKAFDDMNVLLADEANERKKKQEEEELKQKELAELKRLKEKYETV